MKPGSFEAFSTSSFRMILIPVALVLPSLLVSEQVASAQQGWPQTVPSMNSQYVQPNPNYIPSPNKPSPYQYQQADPQQDRYVQQNPPQLQYGQQQPYAQQPAPYPPQQDVEQPYIDPSQADPQQAFGPTQSQQGGQPFAAEQLEQLVAPIALYPDGLVAQILAASTYPAQVVAADNWIHSQSYASPDQIAEGASAQSAWDPSVKALTAFPQVLDLMSQDLRWATDLGNAYYNQPQDVLQTIQVMRQRAQSAGNLQSTPQERVYQNQGYIQVAPVNPQVVYVPMYNPWAVYGAPISPYPGFSMFGALAAFSNSGVVRFGLGMAMGAFLHTPFGWAGWALNWLASGIFFHSSPYYSHSMTVAHWDGWRGGGYNANRGFGGNRTPNGFARPQQAYHLGANEFASRGFRNDGYNRPGAVQGHWYQNYSRPTPQNNAFARPEMRPGNGSSFSSRDGQQFGGRSGPPYSRSEQLARPSGSAYGRNDFNQHVSAGPRGFSGSREYSQSFRGENSGRSHFFGGGGGESHGSYRAPKAPKAARISAGEGRHGGASGHGHHGR